MKILISIIVIIVIFEIVSKIRKSINRKKHKKWLVDRQEILLQDTNRITNKEVRELIVTLQLPPIVLDLFDGKPEAHNLINHMFSPPKHITECMTRKEQDYYNIEQYMPIFEVSDDFLEVWFYDKINKGYIKYYPEDGLELTEYKLFTWEGLFVYVILFWWQCEDTDEIILQRWELL